MRIKANSKGINATIKRLGAEKYEAAVANVVEKHARLQANKAADRAPVDSGLLSGSIQSSPRRISNLTWTYGSNVEYARRQEHEHATKKGFIRKTMFEGRKPFRDDIRKSVRGADKAMRGGQTVKDWQGGS